MPDLNPRVVYSVCIASVVLSCAAYLLYLALSWTQMQDDRKVRLAAVEAIIDRVRPDENLITPEQELHRDDTAE